MSKKLYYLRLAAAMLVACLSVAAFAGWFYKIEIFDWQIAALLQRVVVDFSVVLLGILFVITFLTLVSGRVYCSVLCPLGLMQEMLEFVFGRRRKLQKNRPYKYLIAAGVLGMMLGGSVIAAQKIEPYAIADCRCGLVWGENILHQYLSGGGNIGIDVQTRAV